MSKAKPEWCVIYTRVSTNKQEDKGNSLESQKCACEDHAKYHKMKIRGYFTDTLSGKDMDNRPGFQAAREALQTGDVFLVYQLTRMARNVFQSIQLIMELDQKKCHFQSATEDYNTASATGEMFFTLSAGFAQMERRMIGERVQRGMNFKKEKNEPVGRPRYGQKYVNKRLVPDEYEQEGIKFMKLMRGEGHSLKEVIDDLNNHGYKTKKGGQWKSTSVLSRILTNEPSQPTTSDGA